MGLHLIFAATLASWGWYALNVLEVVIGLGMVIFVHELGHFVVAKLCGVKCEKFYLGFDIAGWKLAKFRWGETEYGIGILPFGGYVKMLGQEDNPARLREEIERAKSQQQQQAAAAASSLPPAATASGTPVANAPNAAQGQTADGQAAETRTEDAFDLAEAEQALYNPRSFLAQTVPERMAIISAGVIMNVVFAVVTAAIAYGIGVRQIECAVGSVFPGEAAWKADLRVGDRIEQIAGRRVSRFNDLQRAVSLGDIENGVPMVVRRPGVAQPIAVTLIPDRKRLAPTIGISNDFTTTLAEKTPAWPGSTASKAGFHGNDRVIRIDDVAIERYDQVEAYLDQHPGKRLQVTVERQAKQDDPPGAPTGPAEQVTVDVAPAPMRSFGLVMAMGPITAVQADSPAMAAGILEGDQIVAVDDQPPGDPATLPDRLRGKSEVALTIRREGRSDKIPLRVKLRKLEFCQPPVYPGNPVAIPQLGLAYQILNRVEHVEPESPAAKAGMVPGDVVHSATLIPPSKEVLQQQGVLSAEDEPEPTRPPLVFDEKKLNWPYFALFALQKILPGTEIQLDLGNERTVKLQATDAKEWFNSDRGFLFQPLSYVQKAESASEAVALGAEETWDSLTLVYRTLSKIGHQVSPKAFGGPVEILRQASNAASRGLSELMLFLTLISANLALLNFLPIPVLDGGHMVFLIYEGITGRMPNERIYVALMYLGLLLILSLMVWVLGLDFGLIPRQ